MNRRIFFICSVLLLSVHSISFSNKIPSASIGAQRVIRNGSPVYDALASLAIEAGVVPFATNGPMTAGELQCYLDTIPYDILSEAGKKKYRWIYDELHEQFFGGASSILNIGIDPSVSLEGYYKTNAEIDWLLPYKDRNPVFSLPVFIAAGDYAAVETEITVNVYESVSLLHNNYSNIPFSTYTQDGNFPHFAYASLGAQAKGKSFINFQIGKGSLNIGRTQMGSIIISDYMRDISYAKFSLFSPAVRFSSYVTQHEVNKYMYFHHIEGRPFPWLSVSMLEGVIVNAPLELRFLNPFMIFHGFGAWQDYGDYNHDIGQEGSDYQDDDSRVSSYLAFTLDIHPWKYTRLYFLYAMNQFQLQYELDTDPKAASIPNGLGGQCGFETYIPFGSGHFFIGAEALYTTPWFYIARNRHWSFTAEKQELYLEEGKNHIISWIGTPFGPDTIAAQIAFGYSEQGLWKTNLMYRFKVSGENDKDLFKPGNEDYYPSTPEQASIMTPSGIPEYSHTVAISGSYEPIDGITLFGQFGISFYTNFDHHNGESQMGAEGALSVKVELYDILQRLYAYYIVKRGTAE